MLFISFTIGCSAKFAKSNYPGEIGRTFNASFDKTWDSILRVIEISNANIITEDKPSGIIVSAIPIPDGLPSFLYFYYTSSVIEQLKKDFPGKVYWVILIKVSSSDTTTVYFTPWSRFGRSMREISQEFFKKIGGKIGE